MRTCAGYPQKVGWLYMKETVLRSISFAHIKKYSWADFYKIFGNFFLILPEIFGLMFFRGFFCRSINIHILTC